MSSTTLNKTSTTNLLTEEERQTIKRFISVLHDVGVQAILVHEYLRSNAFQGDGEIGAHALGKAIEDLTNMDAGTRDENYFEVGPSLRFVRTCAIDAILFEEDFLPSAETIRKCLAGFFDHFRKEITE